MENKSIKIINIVVILLTIVMCFPIVFNIYLQVWGKKNFPTAVTSTYVTTVKNPHTGEELTAIEANYYQNYNGKGKEVVELLFNVYSGVDKQAIYSRGFQLIIDKDKNQLFYYDKYDGVSFETGHEYAWGDPLIVDINGTTYAVRMDGEYNEYHCDFKSEKAWRTGLCLGLNLLFEDTNFYREYYVPKKYTIEDLLLKIKSIIKSSSNGTGDSIIPLIDLGDFLHVYEINDGIISDTAVGKNTLQNSYFTMKTHYDKRGIVWAKQSMFKSVANDSNYNVSGLLDDVDYWQVTSTLTLTQDDFVARNTDKGNYYSLSVTKLTELKNYDNLEINIVFDIDKIKDTVLGLDYYSLIGIKAKSLFVKGTKTQNFELLENSLKDTNIKNISSSNCITIINNNSGVEL